MYPYVPHNDEKRYMKKNNFFQGNIMKTLNQIKTRPTTYRELQQSRLPIKTSDQIRHSHSISGTRGISRLGWRPSDSMIVENLRFLEQNRWTLANWKFLMPEYRSVTIKKNTDRKYQQGKK
jgi:hypothetical protein